MRHLVPLTCLLLLAACDATMTGPTSPLDAEFVLAPGEAAAIERTSLVVWFNGVTGDSRCPADAFCVLGGTAAVHITARSNGSTRDYALYTGDRKPVQHEGMTIALVQLSPFPFSARTIQADEYRATFKVTR